MSTGSAERKALGEWAIQRYHEEVAKHPDGSTEEATWEAIVPEIAERLAELPRDLTAELTGIRSQWIKPERRRRRREMRKDLEWIADFLTDPDSAATFPEFYLDTGYPLGRIDGTDKALRYWTASDPYDCLAVLVEKGEELKRAADALRLTISRMTGVLLDRGALTIGDIFTD